METLRRQAANLNCDGPNTQHVVHAYSRQTSRIGTILRRADHVEAGSVLLLCSECARTLFTSTLSQLRSRSHIASGSQSRPMRESAVVQVDLRVSGVEAIDRAHVRGHSKIGTCYGDVLVETARRALRAPVLPISCRNLWLLPAYAAESDV